MTLAPGARLGPYEIASAIGAGGMGEVYRARDARLGRDVAIKILPDAFAADADRVALRQQQQQLYAALGVDPRVAGACRMREMRAEGRAANGDQGAAQQPAPASQLQIGTPERGTAGRAIRPGLVFVKKGTTWAPRAVMLGAGNFDYTEVVTGIEEGEAVQVNARRGLTLLVEPGRNGRACG